MSIALKTCALDYDGPVPFTSRSGVDV